MTYPPKSALFRSLFLFAAFSGGLGGVLVACTGPQGGSGQSGDPGDHETANDCAGSSWPSAQDEMREASCERPDDDADWLCSCGGGTESASEAFTCSQALLRECGIDLLNPDYCAVPDYGACWPDAETGDFNCLCESGGAEEDWRVAEGADCQKALQNTCVETCADDTGMCSSPTGLIAESNEYSCECFGDSEFAGTTTVQSAPEEGRVSCESILERGCGTSCESAVGACTVGERGYDCACGDGTTGSVSSGRSQHECQMATHAVCGYFNPGPVCSSTNGAVEGACAGQFYLSRDGDPLPTEYAFECECQDGPDASQSSHDASSCEEALQVACPDAIRPPGGTSPLALRDYGQLCEADEDCQDGACYVPGTQQDPICSKDCASDSDCPKGSACYSNHCFITCEPDDDEGCLTLNGAVSNPLFCLDLDSTGEGTGHVCIQESEP